MRSQPGIEVASEATNAETGLLNQLIMIHTQGSDQNLAIADRTLNPTTTG
ncbi:MULTISPECIES: hypothetical protein [Planktothrix]|uniref:Uncharacterized protein n=2 Tax=Planktothrix TaxID=54304 RepID=A0A1J1JBW8_PLAAG|nr:MULTISPECIES: hypothetical protein [Planktothrix]MCF3580943.1 hypothetical protein [Planktothrix agardhii 1811]MBG0746798.1 hypothetical protein [Planktothrix agardhii KL2]MCF3625535.1 hypothetical protein [Planktothrix agardhii 1801]MDS1345793.1 hypothetical protein [Planktothrix agardhii NRERC-751]CAC5343719.1 hypothetical protein PLAN_40134 [Planktothrix rubescens NIVA-CYA 18]